MISSNYNPTCPTQSLYLVTLSFFQSCEDTLIVIMLHFATLSEINKSSFDYDITILVYQPHSSMYLEKRITY